MATRRSRLLRSVSNRVLEAGYALHRLDPGWSAGEGLQYLAGLIVLLGALRTVLVVRESCHTMTVILSASVVILGVVVSLLLGAQVEMYRTIEQLREHSGLIDRSIPIALSRDGSRPRRFGCRRPPGQFSLCVCSSSRPGG